MSIPIASRKTPRTIMPPIFKIEPISTVNTPIIESIRARLPVILRIMFRIISRNADILSDIFYLTGKLLSLLGEINVWTWSFWRNGLLRGSRIFL